MPVCCFHTSLQSFISVGLGLSEQGGLVLKLPYIRRPGILVLINDADWELEGEGKYELQPKDNILFVSTLHGG